MKGHFSKKWVERITKKEYQYLLYHHLVVKGTSNEDDADAYVATQNRDQCIAQLAA
jgi:hypothetical protein